MTKKKIIDGKYEVFDLIGEGGFGKVFKAKLLTDDQDYALKFCLSEDQEVIKRFSREIRLMQQVEHENVIPIIDFNIKTIPPYFVMPLAKGSLDVEIKSFMSDTKKIISLFLEACKGIKAIHDSGKIHRDIKPPNILVLKNDQIVISDFGLGKFEERDSTILTSSRIYMGTEGYLPPEYKTLKGTKNADIRGDIYQLGKTLYNLLTGDNPSVIELEKLDKGIGFIISKATKENPADRYKTVDELISAIENYQISRNPNSHPERKIEKLLKEIISSPNKPEVVDELLQHILTFSGNYDKYLDLFNGIPENVKVLMSKFFPQELLNLSNQYYNSLVDYFSDSRYNFSYAEIVGKSFYPIYKSTSDLNLKGESLKIILYAAVYCNRFATIDQFYSILSSISDDDEAVIIADMLISEKELFTVIAESRNVFDFHPVLNQLFINQENEVDNSNETNNSSNW